MIKLTIDETRYVKTQLRKDLQNGRLKEVVAKLQKDDKDKRIFMFLLEHNIPLLRAFDNIPKSYFAGTELSSIIIPKNIKTIGEQAFANCEHLTSVTIEDGVQKIGDSAFINAKALTKVIIPDSVYKLGQGAFKNCVSLREVYIPDSITILPEGLFEGDENVMIYANSRKSMQRGMKLRCPSRDIDFYSEHLAIKVD